jgi:ABC-type Fe2+-enterobactin transport system substrate-binding protein
MKNRVLVVSVAVLILALAAPVFASQCPTLIKQANDQIATMDQNSEKVKKAKELVAEADRLHKAGTHAESVTKAQEALAVLK